MRRCLYAAAFMCAPAFAQQTVVPDPQLEPQLGRYLIADINRSVTFDRALPPALSRPKPVVNEQDMARVGESLFIERSLLSPHLASEDPSAVRIFRKDAR